MPTGALIALVFLVIPAIALLTEHHRKLTELKLQHLAQLKGAQEAAAGADVSQLREEVREVRELLHELTIAVDYLRPAAPVELQERVRSGS